MEGQYRPFARKGVRTPHAVYISTAGQFLYRIQNNFDFPASFLDPQNFASCASDLSKSYFSLLRIDILV